MNPIFEPFRALKNLGSREDLILSLLYPRMLDAAQTTPNIRGRH